MEQYGVFDSGSADHFNAVVKMMKCWGTTYFIAPSSGTGIIFVSQRPDNPLFLEEKPKLKKYCSSLSKGCDWFRFDFESRSVFNRFRQLLINATMKHFFCPGSNSFLVPCDSTVLPSYIMNNEVYMRVCTCVMKQEETVCS